ncbi:MAG: phospholipase A [Tannerella sp.]|jgi:phospholipase A1|nr:phospholipase A [Tannerella sp.]
MKRVLLLFAGMLSAGICAVAQPSELSERKAHFDSLRTAVAARISGMQPDYNADSVRNELDNGPSFSLYRDNYFIGGIPLGDKMKAVNSNVKFQLSVRQKLTRSRLPFDTYLYIQFTQLTIWNILEESLPVHDMNFNPGIGLGRLIVHKNRYVGNAYLMLEHESNGKDGEGSRSWNKVSFGGNFLLSRNMEMQLKTWVPIVDGRNNRDILKYNGLAQQSLSYWTPGRRLNATLATTWRAGRFAFNTQWELSVKVNNNGNQYLFFQYYNGYGENLLDYNTHRSVLRVGFVIKPQHFGVY